MQLTITEKKEEPMLSRTMLNGIIEFENATPSYKDVSSLIASQLNADEKVVVIRHVYTSFGNKNAQVIAYVYSDEAKKNSIEPKPKEKKDKKAKEAKK